MNPDIEVHGRRSIRYGSTETPQIGPVEADGTRSFHMPGLRFGSHQNPYVVHKKGDWVIVRFPGGMAWNGQGQPWRYHATEFQLINIKTWDAIATATPGRRTKRALDDLKRMIDDQR